MGCLRVHIETRTKPNNLPVKIVGCRQKWLVVKFVYKIVEMTERGDFSGRDFSGRYRQMLRKKRALSFSDSGSDSDDEGLCGSERVCYDSGLKAESEVECDRGWTPGFGWRSRYYSRHHPWVRMPVSGAPFPIGPRRHYYDWIPRWPSRYVTEPITCPEFPDISDEDMFWLMRLILERQGYSGVDGLTEVEHGLYRHLIILLCERAVK